MTNIFNLSRKWLTLKEQTWNETETNICLIEKYKQAITNKSYKYQDVYAKKNTSRLYSFSYILLDKNFIIITNLFKGE